MSSAAGGVNLYYDPLGRLRQMSGGPITDLYLQHDGIQLATEYRINDGAMLKRYVFGPGIDQPLVEYDLAGTRTWLHADERGSVIALSDNSGNVTTINRYDEYGRPQSTNLGRFQYTGQAWLKEIGVYYYKARMYDPALGGRFLQTDPIGPAGGINPYAYVGNDPVNWIDPLGLRWVCVTGPGVDPSTGDVDPGSEVTTCGDNSDPFFDSEVAPLSWTFPRSREFRFTRAGRVNVALAPQQFKIVIVPVQCSSTTSTLGHIAREAGEIADATMGLAFVSGALGLATSETGVGGLTFGGIAVGLGLVSGFASAVQVGAETIDGNRRAATRHALGLTVEQGTSATLSAASKQFGGPGTRLASQAVGQIYGRAISSVTCGM